MNGDTDRGDLSICGGRNDLYQFSRFVGLISTMEIFGGGLKRTIYVHRPDLSQFPWVMACGACGSRPMRTREVNRSVACNSMTETRNMKRV
jgi:hypothetical protein